MNKRRLLCLLLCVVMVASLAVPGTLAIGSATTGSIKVTQNGEKVTSVAIPQNGTATLTASGAGAYQWQILAGDTWVNIQGETDAQIRLSFAMVANLMPTSVRCVSNGTKSEAVEVTVGEAEPFPAVDEFVRPVAEQEPVAVLNETEQKDTAQDAKAEYDRLNEANNAAQAALDQAQADYDAAVKAKEEGPAAIAEAEAKLAAAQEALTNAQNAPAQTVPEATAGEETVEAPTEAAPDLTALQAAVDQAAQELAAAKDRYANADATIEAAAAALEQAKANKDAALKAKQDYTANMGASNSGNNGVSTLADDPTVPATHTVVIKYQFTDGKEAAATYTATVGHGTSLNVTVNSPAVQGYKPDKETITINQIVNEDISETVTYHPAEVKLTVNHYLQHLDDDKYDLDSTVETTGFTESAVGSGRSKTYEGFYSLLYDESVKIAADGSTVVDIYYDRYYYLMTFNLDGGYGVEPIYARYGASISVGTPTRAGYNFSGWDKTIPATMPAENTTYKAQWTAGDKAKVTVLFWGENPNDDEYSFDHTGTIEATPGTEFTFTNNTQFLICEKEEHIHSQEGCQMTCTHQTHTLDCYSLTGNYASYRNLGEVTRPTQTLTDIGNGIYSYTSDRNTYYVVNIGDKWYSPVNYNNQVQTNGISLNCGHTHNASCWSCGKTEHAHSNSEGCFQTGAGMDSKLWKLNHSETVTVAADGTSIVNVYYDRVEFTLTFKDGKTTVYNITEKWGADISAHWPIKGTNGTTYNNGERWRPSGSNTYNAVLVFLDIMPAESFTLSCDRENYDTFVMHYMVEVLPGETGTSTYRYNNVTKSFKEDFVVTANYNYVTEDEDFFDLEGFKQWTSNPTFSNGSLDISGGGDVYFYYERLKYNLSFYNYNTELTNETKSLYYEENISKNVIAEPPYPSGLEPNAYEFEGWYFEAALRNKVDAQDTMPASDVMLYAKWVPVTHTVTFALDKDAQQDLYPAQTVSHGSKITAVNTPTNGSYTFVGWFYDDNGVEKAFDPANMPVNRDLNLYGKWSANTLVDYTIRYVTMENGVEVEIAAPTTGKALALTTKTFDAKAGDELYADYQVGYFPTEASHSITMSAEQGAKNEFTFVYEPKTEVPYTVYYVTKIQPESGNYGTVELNGKTAYILAPTKNTASRNAIVTENYVPVTGYMPNQFQQRLILTADGENVLIFWYEKDTEHAPVRIVDHFQNIAGTGYADGVERSTLTGKIGETQSADPLTNQPGFQYDHATHQTFAADSVVTPVTDQNGHVEVTLTADGLQIDYYYNRIQYPYEFRFLEQGTNKKLAEPVANTGRYQDQVNQRYKTIPGYTLVGPENLAITIAIEDTPVQNVATFYYQEKDVTINYQIVGPDGCGSLSLATETVKAVNGPVTGSTATATASTYKFVGWFKDEACTQPVDTAWVTNDTHITPAKTGNKNEAGEAQTYEAATYYAKFEYNLTSMTIKKEGKAYEASDSFIFDIYHNGAKVTTVTMKLGESKTISGLTVGEKYTVKERTAGTRYDDPGEMNCTLVADKNSNTVTFNNTVKTDKWLTSSKTVPNVFKGKN